MGAACIARIKDANPKMSTRYPTSLFVGDEGMDYIALVCSRSHDLFLPRPRQDIGIDGHIEFLTRDGEATGAIAFVQSKAGTSYVDDKGRYVVKGNKAHFITWSRYHSVVLGVVYNPVKRDARWVDITAHLRSNPRLIETGPYTITAPQENIFSEDNFEQLRAYVQKIHNQTEQQPAHELMERFLNQEGSDVEEALTLLFTHYRGTRTVCFFVHNAIRLNLKPGIIEYLVYLMSFYRPDLDRLYTGEDIAPTHLAPFAAYVIHDFEIREMIKMLAIIDPEEGVDRGTLGEMVALQFMEIDNVEAKLKRLVRDVTLDANARLHGLVILYDYFPTEGKQMFRFYGEMLRKEQDPSIREVLLIILRDWELT